MDEILKQIDGVIEGVFHLPKSDATDMILADLQDLRDMVEEKQGVSRVVCKHKNRYTIMVSGSVFCLDCGEKI